MLKSPWTSVKVRTQAGMCCLSFTLPEATGVTLEGESYPGTTSDDPPRAGRSWWMVPVGSCPRLQGVPGVRPSV